jgi:S-adenosylmethionine:tRNA-ribosyltransferase-isomerase (queuine synthetase)
MVWCEPTVDNQKWMCITNNEVLTSMDLKAVDLLIDEYDYPLSAQKIAEFPLSERDESRLLEYKNGIISDHLFKDLDSLIPKDSLLILNDTKVIQARLFFKKATGGVIELFLLEPHNEPIENSLLSHNRTVWNCLIGGASKWKPGQILSKEITISGSADVLFLKYLSKEEDHFVVELSWNGTASFSEIIHHAGSVPLPPYIKRESVESDKNRYQTIFSKYEGSVAAPTAALHFTAAVFERLRKKNVDIDYITLHVGAGTFKPVKTSSVSEHHMHEEPFTIKKKLLKTLLNAKTVLLVGTTTLRTLESIYWLGVKLIEGNLHEWKLNQWEAYSLFDTSIEKDYKSVFREIIKYMDDQHIEELHCSTSLIIVPGYKFQVPDGLITNFHQPKSTLLLLVSAFTGNDWKKIYSHALENDYRFLSYGDGSLLWRKK